MKKRSHMNFCKDCRKAFEITVNVDYCDVCRIILDINSGEYSGESFDELKYPEITQAIIRRYMEVGYE